MVDSIRIFVGDQVMYNLTVDVVHTYYVMVGLSAVLVHNAPCNPEHGPAYMSDERWIPVRDGHTTMGVPEGNDGVFLAGTRAEVQDLIHTAIQKGRVEENDGGPGYKYTYDNNGYQTGYKNGTGQKLYFVTVIVNEGRIVTAYPN